MIIINDADFRFKDTCVTVGKFDTLHIGHKALMERRVGHFTVRNATLSDYYQCVYELADRFGVEENARVWLETMNEITGVPPF